jgi:hypothetical protein
MAGVIWKSSAKKLDADYIISDTRLRRIAPLISGWIEAVEDLSEAWGDVDAPYFYNERANVSLLAGGAWKMGYQALEEYRSPKRGRESSQKIYKAKHDINGRVDLYITRGSEWDVLFEAKHHWMAAMHREDANKTKIREALNIAHKDSRRDKGAEANLSCVFFVPRFPVSKVRRGVETIDSLIVRHIKTYLEIRASAWAWCFPKVSRDRILETENAYYPGVIMGITVSKYWKR